MTRKEFVERHRHEVVGIAFEAAMAKERTGAQWSMFMSTVMGRVVDVLGAAWDDAHKPAEPPANRPQQQAPPAAAPGQVRK